MEYFTTLRHRFPRQAAPPQGIEIEAIAFDQPLEFRDDARSFAEFLNEGKHMNEKRNLQRSPPIAAHIEA